MTSILKEIAIHAQPYDVWAALRDFGAVDRLAAGFVTESVLEGDVRTVTFFNGAVAREVLIGTDEAARRLAYSVIDSPLGMTHHNASAQVVAAPGTGSRFVWIADVLPAEAAVRVAVLMDLGLVHMKEALEARVRT